MHAQIDILSESDNTFLITKMLDNRYFLFIYNSNEIRMGKEEFSEPRWTVYDFSCNKIIAIKAQIHSWNFKIRS